MRTQLSYFDPTLDALPARSAARVSNPRRSRAARLSGNLRARLGLRAAALADAQKLLESIPSSGLTGLLHRGAARRAERRVEALRERVRTTAARLRRVERVLAESGAHSEAVMAALMRDAA